jgi:hypothetical protein
MASNFLYIPPSGGGSGAGVSSFNTLTGAVTISAGSGITLTPTGNNIAISASGGGGSGTVTSVSVVSANGFAGTVATATTTPAITLTTSITGVLKGNGTAISAATAGTDYVIPSGNITGTASNITGTTNSTITTLSALSLPYSQLTGTPSLNYLPLSGGTMTGPAIGTGFTINAGSTTTPYGSPVVNITNGANTPYGGLSLTTSTGRTLYFDNSTGSDGFALTFGTTGQYFFNYSYASTFLALGNNNSVSGNDPAYPVNALQNQSNWNPLTQLVPNAGYSSPVIAMSNISSTTTNNWAGYVTTGASLNPMSFLGTRHNVQTSGSEQADFHIMIINSGALTDAVKISGQTGQFSLEEAGAGLSIKEGSNCKQGVATLVAGTVTVSNTSVTANSRVYLTHQNTSGTLGVLYLGTVTAGTSFVINSSSALDTSIVAYFITEPS